MAAWREQRMRALASGELVTKQFRAETGGGENGTDGATDIYLYDVIDSWGGYWGISAGDVVAALQGVGDVTVHINSPGGEVFEALAIYATFRNHPGNVTMRVEGYAASAASVVMLGGNRVVMEPNAMVMIHDAWGIEIGNAGDLHAYADLLDKASQNLATIYHAKAPAKTADEWRDAMRPLDTWFTAQEALDAGLADEINQAAAADPVEQAGFAAAWDGQKIRAMYQAQQPVPVVPAARIIPVGEPFNSVPAEQPAVTIPGWSQFRAAVEGMKR